MRLAPAFPYLMKHIIKDPRTPYCAIIALLGLVLLGMTAIIAYVGLDEWRRYAAFENRETISRQQLANMRAEHNQQSAYLEKLLSDPEFFERVVRERLGYSREGETVIRFKE